jgi:hypothetical protein
MDDHGISLTCPAEAPASGPIPVEAHMRADPRTYWDNEGILDNALTVALVRRDRPGLRFLPKIDPHAIMLPDPPLPGRPTDQQLDAERWTVGEVKQLDATLPAEHARGAADYFVTAGFSKWWAGPCELKSTAPLDRRAPAPAADHAPDGRPWPVQALSPGASFKIRVERGKQGSTLVLPFHVDLSKRGFPQPGERYGHAWLTVLGFHLTTKGGACGGLFAIDVQRTAGAVSGQVAVPLPFLVPGPTAGRWLFQAFLGYEALSPAEVTLTDADVI